MKLDELIKEFEKLELPEKLTLGPHEIITDFPLFLKSHIDLLRANPGNKRFMPYWNRLLKAYQLMSK